MYSHLFRKIFTNVITTETESSWKSGVTCFFLFHVTVFFGLVLCSTHLSDVTLRIASNVLCTFTRDWNYLAWFIFTDKSLNIDTMVRMELLHYYLGGVIILVGFNHGVDMHYDWKVDTSYTGLKECISWIDEGVISELGQAFFLMCIVCFISKLNYHSQEPISYEVFTFGDLGIIIDVNF